MSQPASQPDKSMAQIAYEACNAKLNAGAGTPWAELGLELQEGWHAAVNAVQLETVRATQRAHGIGPG